jgi:microcystin-dependent protein
MDPFIAEIRINGFNFAPKGWALCNGQILSISQNTALFSLLGTTYGGNGTSNFALPNLQGSFPMHPGQALGGTPHVLGEKSGSPTVTLLASEMPAHSHAMVAGPAAPPVVQNPSLARSPAKAFDAGPPDSQLAPDALALAGGSLPHNNMSPYLGLNFCIALVGIFPARN